MQAAGEKDTLVLLDTVTFGRHVHTGFQSISMLFCMDDKLMVQVPPGAPHHNQEFTTDLILLWNATTLAVFASFKDLACTASHAQCRKHNSTSQG